MSVGLSSGGRLSPSAQLPTNNQTSAPSPSLSAFQPYPSTSRSSSNSDFSTVDPEPLSVWSTGLMSDPRAEPSPSQFYFGPQPGLSFAIQGDNCQANCRDDFVSTAWNDRNSSFFGCDFNRDSSVSGPYTDPNPSTKSQFDWSTKQPNSRKSSASSSTTSDSSGFSPQTGSSSLSSSWSEDQVPTLKRLARPQLVGEDPALAAARRALWDDMPASADQSSALETLTESEISQVDNSSDEDGGDDFDEDEPVALRNERLFALPPAPHEPKRLARPQLVSCLRTSSSTSSRSASYMSHSFSSATCTSSGSSVPLTPTSSISSHSVQFSDEPPVTLVTYSKHDYVRRGDAAVEKLSVRDWIELRDVKSVAVWSGKVAKWDEAAELTDAGIEQPQSPTSRPTTIDTLLDIQASELTTPTKLTLSEKRGKGALEAVRSMDAELLVRPHYSPSVHSTTHSTQLA